jgi:hypothetical protein
MIPPVNHFCPLNHDFSEYSSNGNLFSAKELQLRLKYFSLPAGDPTKTMTPKEGQSKERMVLGFYRYGSIALPTLEYSVSIKLLNAKKKEYASVY